jgi:hypothetical protein
MVVGCSVTHPSDQYACNRTQDCMGNRQCIGGFCVVPGSIDAARNDGPGKNPDGSNCPAPCTSCNVGQKMCTVDCSLTGACGNTLTCPTGYTCDFECKTDSSCQKGINCQLASACQVECSGTQSCHNVACGAGPCDVSCSGQGSCRGVSCGMSCACNVLCNGPESCANMSVQCTSIACENGSGCTSVPAFCHTGC